MSRDAISDAPGSPDDKEEMLITQQVEFRASPMRRLIWLLLGVLIAGVPAAASVANIRAGRGDLADVLWLAFSAGCLVWLLPLRSVNGAWMRQRRRPSLAEMADPAYNPDLDRHEAALRQAFREEVGDV